MRLVKSLGVAIAASSLAVVATPASASILITGHSLDSTARGGTVHVGNLSLNRNVGAGQFTLTGTDLDTSAAVSFQTFCIEISTWFTNNSTYTIQSISGAGLDPVREAQLAGLLINGTNLIGTTAGVTTAIQLAIWEILYETDGTYNLASGNFYADGGFAGSQALANTYLANVTSGTWTGDTSRIRTLISAGSQDQVFVNPVPEPGTWAMMLLGFGLVGGVVRRSKRATARVKFNLA